MHRKSLSLLAVVGLAVLISGRDARGQARAVLMSHCVTNEGSKPATVKVKCTLPATNGYQEVLDVAVLPEPLAEAADDQGQRVVTVELKDIPAGESRAVLVLAWVRLKSFTVPLTGPARNAKDLSKEARDAFLQDGPLLTLEKVRATAKQAVGNANRDVDKAQRIYTYMAEQCRYNIDASQDPADEVIGGKPASCSELAYTFAALCRAAGIPARTVRAFVNRESSEPWIDWQTHRWAEFYAEGIGWVPVDPTNALNYPEKQFFARQDERYVALVDDASEPRSRLLPDSLGFALEEGPVPAGLFIRFSGTCSPSSIRNAEKQFFQEAHRALYNPDVAARKTAVESWGRGEAALASGFLVEALFDPSVEVRKAAVEGFVALRDISAIQPFMDRSTEERDAGVKEALFAAVNGFLADPDEKRQAEAVSELAKTRSPKALELVAPLCTSPSREVRKAVALTLSKFGDRPEVHEAYRELARDRDSFIRVAAILRWARVGSTEAVKLLPSLLESNYAWDRAKGLEELKRRTGKDYGFNSKQRPTTESNREAIALFRRWVEDHPEAK